MKQLLLFATLIFGSLAVQAQSIEALRDSMAAGNLNSQVDLALKYMYGEDVEQDIDKAFSLIRDAANKGNSNGELWLGLCYHYASGVDQDFEEAFRWFSRSAQKGNKLAMGCVGQAYDSGQGVEQDQAMAIKYYQQGAENGDAVSQAALGLHYLMGQGIEQDWTKGFVLLKLAADQGHTDAMQWLPYCYFNGWGTEKNNQEAINVLTRLKEEQFDDDEDAQQNIDDMIATINRGDTLSAYEFQFRILPIRLLQGYANFALDEDELIDLTQLRLELGSMFISHYECDLDSLFISTHQVDDSTTVHVIHMPEPSRPPLCKYAAFVIDKKNCQSRYYTLEKTYNLFGESGVADPYVVGGMAIDDDEVNEASSGSDYPDGFTHHNYGWLEGEPTEENFVRTILHLFKDK